MDAHPVTTTRRLDGITIHLHQVVRDAGGRDWIVVGLDDSIVLGANAFDWTRTLSPDEFLGQNYTPVYAGAVPVWGY